MTEFLKNLWLKMFGTTEWLGLNIGFWVSMFAVVLLVVLMVVVFWSMKPKKKNDGGEAEKPLPPKSNPNQEQQ